MKFAQILVGLPLEGPFDYSIPHQFRENIKIGSRVRIDFANRRLIGYIVGLSCDSKIKKTKPILELIDKNPILDDTLLKLTKVLSQYYCCFWSEMIEAALPLFLKNGKRIDIKASNLKPVKKTKKQFPLLIYDQDGSKGRPIYYDKINRCIKEKQDIIFLLPEVQDVLKISKNFEAKFKDRIICLYRTQSQKQSEEAWVKIRNSSGNLIIGTRSAIFAPTLNLGLIIIDKEENRSYKQDQSPFYHARIASLMRAKIENIQLIISSVSPSLDSYYQAINKKYKLKFFKKNTLADIRIIDMVQELINHRKKTLISLYLENEIRKVMRNGKKVVLFLNRQGFATQLRCRNCGFVISCPRCSSSLVYHYDQKKLLCRFCNYKTDLLEICPECNKSYIKYLGQGIEKLESSLYHMFPAAKIIKIDKKINIDFDNGQIFLFTKPISLEDFDFKDKIGLVGIVALDTFFNRIDFRAAEKAFFVISQLLNLNPNLFVIQSYTQNYLLDILKKKNMKRFYTKELNERKELDFPPFSHFATINLRSKNEENVKNRTFSFYEELNKINIQDIEVLSVNKANLYKLRGNYRYEILLKTSNPSNLNVFLKKELQEFNHSGIIVNVDVDPF
ncbi:MAG: primosomal protein N' [Candidatus Omnitrophota bacterium]